MQRTLIIFKPDCMEKRLVGSVLDRFEKAGAVLHPIPDAMENSPQHYFLEIGMGAV